MLGLSIFLALAFSIISIGMPILAAKLWKTGYELVAILTIMVEFATVWISFIMISWVIILWKMYQIG